TGARSGSTRPGDDHRAGLAGIGPPIEAARPRVWPRRRLGSVSGRSEGNLTGAGSYQGPCQHGDGLVSGRSATVVAMNSSAISVSRLRRALGATPVPAGLALEVRAGTTFALLGPTGAGKPTTGNVLTPLLTPAGGRVAVAGPEVATKTRAVRAAVGVTG